MKKEIFLILIFVIFLSEIVLAESPSWSNLKQNPQLVYDNDVVNFSVMASDPSGIKEICFRIQKNTQPYTSICDDSMSGETELFYSIEREFEEEVDTRFQWYFQITNLNEETNRTPSQIFAITTPPGTLNDVPVTIRSDNILLIDGEPFFPVGMYSLTWNETDSCRIHWYGASPYSSNPFADLNRFNLNFFFLSGREDFYYGRCNCGESCWNCGEGSCPVFDNPSMLKQCYMLLENSEAYNLFPSGTNIIRSAFSYKSEDSDDFLDKRNLFYLKLSSFLNCLSQHNTPFIYYSYDEINAHASWIDPLLEPYGTNTQEKLNSTYTLLKQADPFHPVWTNLGPSIGPGGGSCGPNNVECNLNKFIENSRKYTESSDIVSIDYYLADDVEFYMKPGSITYEFTKRIGGPLDISAVGYLTDIMVNEVTEGKKPFWLVADHSKASSMDPRGPTLKEKRFMAYQAIIHGATGIIYFTWGDDAWTGYKYTNSSGNSRYFIDDTSLVANEIQTLSPILLDGLEKEGISVNDDKIEFLAKEFNDELYILSVNAEDQEKNVTFVMPQEYNGIQVLFKDNTNPTVLDSFTFSDHFDRFGVNIYKINLTEPETPSLTYNITRPLNLISIPFELDDDSLEGAFGDALEDITDIYTYDSENEWSAYHNDPSLPSSLDQINPRQGYFILTNNDVTLEFNGTISQLPLLKKGWNLIGSGSINNINIEEDLIDVTYSSVWGFNQNMLGYEELEDPIILEPGKAYWIDIKTVAGIEDI